MGPLVVLLLVLLAVSLPLLKKLAEGNRAGKKLPPGPWRIPIIGNLHQVGSMPHRSFLRLSQKHGPLMFLYLGSIPTLVVSSADALKSIFKSHDIIFSGRPASTAATLLSFNNSNISFAQYGENWRQARKISMLELLSPRRVRSFQIVREQEVGNLSAAITDLSSKSSLINLSEMISALSYNVLCRVVFGDKLGGGDGVYRGQRSLSHRVMAETQNLVVGFFAADFFPGGDWIDGITGQRAKLEKNFGELNRFWERVIEEHLKGGTEKEVDDVSDREDLVSVLLRLHREAADGGFLSTMNHVKGIMGDLFFAGTDTSSATIIWTMTELMKNPRVMTKLQQELQTTIINNNNNKVEESDLQQLQYLKLVIKESLRLHSPAPLLVPRETIESCVIEGYDIPAKTRVFINAAAISMDPKAWKNPNEFWPERFALRGSDLREQDFNYVPFGVGRRSCPGVDFAAVLVELVLANLLFCFEWSLPDGMRPEDIDMGEAIGLTMHKKVPLCMVAKPMM